MTAPSYPQELLFPVQLEEQEEDTTTLTSLEFMADGSMRYMTTDGPLPVSLDGVWGTEDGRLVLIIT